MNKKLTEITLNLSSNLIGNSNDEIDFPHELLLSDTHVSEICKAFLNCLSANVKFSKNQMSKTVQLGGFVIRDIPIFGNVLSNTAKDGIDITKNYASNFVDKKIDMFNKKYITGKSSGITLKITK